MRRELEGARHRVGDAHVRLVRHEHVEVVDRHTGAVECLAGDLGHLERRPAEHGVAVHPQRRHLRVVHLEDVRPRLVLPDQVELRAVGAPDDGADALDVGGADHRGPCPVGEDERRTSVGRVGDVGESLDPDGQDVLRASRPHHVGRERDAETEPGARRRDVEGCCRGAAELLGDEGRDRWGLQQVGDRCHDDAVDLAGLDAGALERRTGRRDTHHLDGLVRFREAALDDAGAGADPLVAGVDVLTDLGVRDDSAGTVAGDAIDPCVCGALHRRDLAPSTR